MALAALIVASVALALIIGAAVTGVLRFRGAAQLLPTAGADAKTPPDTSVPQPPAQSAPFGAGVTGGTFHPPTIPLPQGTTLTLTSSLVVIADQSLTISGAIALAPTGPTIDITLVSLHNDVYVDGTIGVPSAFATAGIGNTGGGVADPALGGAGGNGGYVKIAAPEGSIRISGTVAAQHGGFGGNATATGTATGLLPGASYAIAAAGEGG